MANTKRITLDHQTPGMKVYMIVVRESDGYYLDSNGTFVSSFPSLFTVLAEDATIRGRYAYDDARAVWSDGKYSFYLMSAISNDAAIQQPAQDTRVGIGEMIISEDAEVGADIPRVGLRRGQAFPNFIFPMLSASTGEGLTGLTVTAQRVLDGGAIAPCSNPVSEVSSGFYRINLATGDLTADCAGILFSAPGARPQIITVVTQR